MGVFEKQLKEKGFVEGPSSWNFKEENDAIALVNAFEVLAEAKKEFPWDVLCSVTHPMGSMNKKRLEDWFMKWFGE